MHIINIITILILIATTIYYNVLWDIVLLVGLMFIAYLAGSFIKVKLNKLEKMYIQLIIGLGLIGFFTWVSIIVGFNSLSLYSIMIFVLCIMRREQIKDIYMQLRSLKVAYWEASHKKVVQPILNIFLVPYIILASYPIYNYDALVKHVPIALNLINKGEFPINVIESIVYGEISLLRYTYTYLLMLFGGTKVIVLFEVSMLMLIFLGLLIILRHFIKSNFTDILLIVIYFSTPLVVNRGSTINPDVLPIVFLMPIVVWLIFVPTKEIINKLPIMGLLFGFSAASKLTTFPYMLTLTLVFIVHVVKYCIEEKNISKCISSILKSIGLFLIIFLPNALRVWYYTGNPVFPFYNEIFKSPYYSLKNFTDPFDTNPLTLSIKSLFSMVFDTHKNIEMVDGGLGYYLLLIPVALVVMFIFKNRSYLWYGIIVLASYAIGVMFTSNIRYLMGSYMGAMVMVVVAMGYFVNYIKVKRIRHFIMICFMAIMVIPNILYIKTNMLRKDYLVPDSSLTKNANFELLSHINHEDTRVLAYGDEFKGEFKGEYYNFNWYNTYLNTKLITQQIEPIQYLGSFDYLLYNKNTKQMLSEIVKIIELNKSEIKNMITPFMESDTHILYKVDRTKAHTKEIIVEEKFEAEKIVNVSNPYFEKIEDEQDYDYYQIEVDAYKISEEVTYGRWQINWYNNNDELIDLYLKKYEVEKGTNKYISPPIVKPEDAEYGMLYINGDDENEIGVEAYKLVGGNKIDIIESEKESFTKGIKLK